MLYIFLLPIVIVALLALPVVIAVKKQKGEKSVRHAVIGNLCAFFGVMVICAALPLGMYASAEESPANETSASEEADEGDKAISDTGIGYIAAALAVGLGSIGGGLAVAAAAPAAIGAVSEDPKSFSKALIFVALGEGCALYGFVVALLMLFI
ncbi:MAG: ATP synthase subunit C [Oscillospiraceae bacterium]|nr:ATP synthase subunit C [Oscillospiraceae bacterium]